MSGKRSMDVEVMARECMKELLGPAWEFTTMDLVNAVTRIVATALRRHGAEVLRGAADEIAEYFKSDGLNCALDTMCAEDVESKCKEILRARAEEMGE